MKTMIFDENFTTGDILNYLTDMSLEAKYVYRGYGKQAELLPSIIRNKSYENVESRLLSYFEKYASHYFHAHTPIDFMSYAQHFGIPTRLLDFTYNPFIALSFSLYKPKSNGNYSCDEDKDYYYIRYASLQDNLLIETIDLTQSIRNVQIFSSNSFAEQSILYVNMLEDLFGENEQQININVLMQSKLQIKDVDDITEQQKKMQNRTILFIDPNQSNQRIIMQQGLFMLPYTINKSDHLSIIEKNSAVIKIHKTHREKLLSALDTMGYNTFRLMPDLPSICQAITRKVTDERTQSSNNFKK